MALFFRKRRRPQADVDVEPWKDHAAVSRETAIQTPPGPRRARLIVMMMTGTPTMNTVWSKT